MGEYFDGDARKASRYLEAFERLQRELPGALALKGDTILVEKLPKVELKSKSGLILSVDVKTHRDTSQDALTEFGIVLATGPGQVFEDGTVYPCDAKPGDVILLPGNVFWYSQFGHIAAYDQYSIGRMRDSQIPMWFAGDYRKVFEVLNG